MSITSSTKIGRGFGERSNRVDQTGGTVESYVSDGPYQAVEYPFLSAFVPPWGLRDGRQDATYFPMPWLLSTNGYGVLVDNPQTSLHRVRSSDPGAWSVEVTNAPSGEVGAELAPPINRLSLRFFAGPRPADVLRRLTDRTGRQLFPQNPADRVEIEAPLWDVMDRKLPRVQGTFYLHPERLRLRQ